MNAPIDHHRHERRLPHRLPTALAWALFVLALAVTLWDIFAAPAQPLAGLALALAGTIAGWVCLWRRRGSYLAVGSEKRIQGFANAQLAAAVEELGESFVLCDAQDRILIANRRFRAMNPAVVSVLAQGGTFESFVRLAVAQGAVPASAGREEEFIAERMQRHHQYSQPFERPYGDGRWDLISEFKLADGATVITGLDITARKDHERVLAQSEAQLQAVLDNAPAVAVQQYDQQGRVLYWNRASEDLYGFSSDQAVGKTLDQLMWTPEQAQHWLDNLHRAAAMHLAIGPEEQAFIHQSGEKKAILFSSFAIPDVDGGFRFVCMDVDITPRKRAEDELRASRKLMEVVVDAIPFAIFAKDTKSNYTMVNKSFADFHGCSKQEILCMNTAALPTPAATRQKSLQDDAVIFTGGRTLDQPDVLLQNSRGEWIPFHSLKMPLRNSEGEVIGLLGLNRNISQEKRIQETLRASEARFSAMFYNSQVPQVVSDPKSGISEEVNDAFSNMCGYPKESLIGAHEGIGTGMKLGLMAPDIETIMRIHAQGGTLGETLDLQWRRADGTLRVAQTSANLIETSAGLRMVWSFIDVTEQRNLQRQLAEQNMNLELAVQQRTEQLIRTNSELVDAMKNLKSSQDALVRSEKLAALGRMVAGVAHELNTPIGNSLLCASTLNQHTQSFAAEAQQGLRRSTLTQFVSASIDACALIERNLERAAELIRSFKQIAVDQTSSQRRVFDLSEVVGEVLISIGPALKDSSVNIGVDIPAGLRLDSYPGPLGQVIANLVNNAVMHGFSKGDIGKVTVMGHMDGAAQVVLCVKDDGKGIAPNDLKRIFDPFFTTRMGNGGTGLGLNIVHNLVTQRLGGCISVSSEPGQGAQFAVTLPLVAPRGDGEPQE